MPERPLARSTVRDKDFLEVLRRTLELWRFAEWSLADKIILFPLAARSAARIVRDSAQTRGASPHLGAEGAEASPPQRLQHDDSGAWGLHPLRAGRSPRRTLGRVFGGRPTDPCVVEQLVRHAVRFQWELYADVRPTRTLRRSSARAMTSTKRGMMELFVQKSGVAQGCPASFAAAFDPQLLARGGGREMVRARADDAAVGCASVTVLPVVDRAMDTVEQATGLRFLPHDDGGRPHGRHGVLRGGTGIRVCLEKRAPRFGRVAVVRSCKLVGFRIGVQDRAEAWMDARKAAARSRRRGGHVMLRLACHFYGTAALSVLGVVAQLAGPLSCLRCAKKGRLGAKPLPRAPS